MTKIRLDLAMTEGGLAPTRQKAQGMIMAGQVYVDGQKETKAGAQVTTQSDIQVRGDALPYVSRGGLKLEKAANSWSLELEGLVCGDIGASTGGFTDCMLQRGAKLVYAVDSGYNQLAWSLRSDPRVVCLERTNARYLTKEHIPQPLDFFSVDVSFISLRLILPPLRLLVRESAAAVCLIKPQFEAGREKVGKKGVVRDAGTHLEVLENFLRHADGAGFSVEDLTFSPIKGPEGNMEYLGLLRPERGPAWPGDLRQLVHQAHQELKEQET